ncbi:hypothetical protein BH10ACI3_BH10ACI3_28460 [soil metagenome]
MKFYRIFGKAVLVAVVLMIAVSAASAKGRKFGLFVGINKYQDGIHPLSGCVNDATKMRDTLVKKFGFKLADTTLLTDADATRANILAKLKMYQGLARKGDIFVFHYSGHGTLFPDKYSEFQDETETVYMEAPDDDGKMEVIYPRDKYDSAICPVDSRSTTSGKPWRNIILDDELYEMFSGFTQKGAKVDLISDSCHSGTIARAGASDKARRKTEFLATVFGAARFSDLKFDAPSTRANKVIIPPVKGLYISLSGAKDNEFSLDADDKGVPMGLFTLNLLRALNGVGGTKLTYSKLITKVAPSVSKEAKDEYDNDQNPQLGSEFGNAKALVFSAPVVK